MKVIFILLALLIFCYSTYESSTLSKEPETVSSFDTPPEYSFKINSIDTDEIIKGLDVVNPEVDKSDEGDVRIRWNINGLESSRIESIGDPKNAYVLSGKCSEYDENGNSAGWPNNGKCAALFRGLMKNILHNPNPAADYSMKKAGLLPFIKGDLTVHVRANHLYLRLHSDGFFFLRNDSLKK